MTAHTKLILQIVSYLGLILSIVPALLVFKGQISKDVYFNLMAIGMVMWFSTAVCWIKADHAGH